MLTTHAQNAGWLIFKMIEWFISLGIVPLFPCDTAGFKQAYVM